MGYRGQNSRDDAETRRWRATVPLRRRLFYSLRAVLIVSGILAALVCWVFSPWHG